MDIKQFLDQDEKKDLLRILTAGSVDDGKSTLIGRLLFDSKLLYEDQLSALKRDSKREGHAGDGIDYALLLDGLKAEREQGITIDVAYRYFSTNKRKFIIADTPGHEQYTRNMVTGASTANLAILLIDATKGVITQTKRHTFIVSLLGIRHIVIAINKMDLVDFSKDVFDNICQDYREFVTGLNIPDIRFIPMSALKGDNVVDLSEKTPWYHGKSMLEFLEDIHISSDRNFSDLRFPVQYVNRPSRDFRGFATSIASGIIRKGETIKALPSGKTSKVKTIIGSNGEQDYAFPPQSVTITLEDEIDISRGEMIVHPDNMPHIERHFEAMIVWMDEKPMNTNTQFFIKHTTNTTKVRIDNIRYKIDVNTLERSEIDHFELNEIGRVVLTTNKTLFFDPYKKNHNTGSFVLIDPITHNTSAVGMIIDKLSSDQLPSKISFDDREKIHNGECLIKDDERENRYKQKGETIWITGLHGSGKNHLAFTLEKQLFNMGATVVLLDGSSVRTGLSRELDYSPTDRAEHLRRVAEVCKILNDQGIIVICSFISPKENIRRQVREIIDVTPETSEAKQARMGNQKPAKRSKPVWEARNQQSEASPYGKPEARSQKPETRNLKPETRFHLIYMDASLEYCKKNKPELYQKAEKGELKYLPGVDTKYEIPQSPVLRLKPENSEKNTEKIIRYLSEKKVFPVN